MLSHISPFRGPKTKTGAKTYWHKLSSKSEPWDSLSSPICACAYSGQRFSRHAQNISEMLVSFLSKMCSYSGVVLLSGGVGVGAPRVSTMRSGVTWSDALSGSAAGVACAGLCGYFGPSAPVRMSFHPLSLCTSRVDETPRCTVDPCGVEGLLEFSSGRVVSRASLSIVSGCLCVGGACALFGRDMVRCAFGLGGGGCLRRAVTEHKPATNTGPKARLSTSVVPLHSFRP